MYNKIQFWLDNWLPWRLRRKISALKAENNTLCNQLSVVNHDLFETKWILREYIKKMHMPLRGSLRKPDFSSTEADSISPYSIMQFFLDRQVFSFSVDKYSFPRYNEKLLSYMAGHTAEQMIEAIKDYVRDQVFDFYKKEFKEDGRDLERNT